MLQEQAIQTDVDIPHPTLKFVHRLEIDVDDPVVVPSGPRGARYCIPVLGGTFHGVDENIRGDIVSPSSDFAVGHADGSGVSLKVNFVMKTHDGAALLGIVEGRSARDPKDPTCAQIHSSKTFETGDERFRWMNNQVFVGRGKKEGKKVMINYYQVIG
mmetsp:Transcript_25228/g.53332  ORF Transcript_25228/g.53332 Transcript_25228/m.53332 type:complete len:158 (+) Transcript_25228:15-488(+)